MPPSDDEARLPGAVRHGSKKASFLFATVRGACQRSPGLTRSRNERGIVEKLRHGHAAGGTRDFQQLQGLFDAASSKPRRG